MSKKTNILILFTDMQRADTIAALGNPVIRTPSLDRLVNEGVAFKNCFTPSPVCVSARCSLHYGKYPHHTGCTDNGHMIPHKDDSYPALLTAAGYRTHAIGKCHFTPDPAALRGFETRESQEEITSDAEKDDYIRYLKDRGLDDYEAHGARGEMYYIPQISSLSAEHHPTQWVADRSLEFIEEASGSDQPWCLFSSYIHPHPPFTPPKPWHKLYRGPDMPLPNLPANSETLLTWINRRQNRYKYRDQGTDLQLLRMIKAYYYACISFVDYQVGRLISKLEEKGELDNTLILFTSDHGEYLGDYNCFGKRAMHDPSARIPMILRHPETFRSGQVCDTAVSLVDVLPTLTSAAGLDYPGVEHDGMDLADIASQESNDRTVYSQYQSGEQAIHMAVNHDWKYVLSVGDQREFLFNRFVDPLEGQNVAASITKAETTRKFREDLLTQLGGDPHDSPINPEGQFKNTTLIDESYLKDPGAGQMFQDYPSYDLDLPGYSN